MVKILTLLLNAEIANEPIPSIPYYKDILTFLFSKNFEKILIKFEN